MTEQLNLIAIFCLVSLDSVEESGKTDAQKIILKNHINNVFNIAFKYIGQTNRIILLTDNSAEIAYLGLPENAMLVAKDILSGIVISNKKGSAPLSVRIAIHLKPVYEESDFNKQSNIVGNGINAAKQMISEVKPNEILVSRAYKQHLSAPNQLNSSLLSGQQDKVENQVQDDEAYLANLNPDLQAPEDQPSVLLVPIHASSGLQTPEKAVALKTGSWKYALASLFVAVSIVSIAELINMLVDSPDKKVKTMLIRKLPSADAITLPAKPEAPLPQANVADEADLSVQNEAELTEAVKPLPAKKKVKQPKNTAVVSAKKDKGRQAINWETLKKSFMQGQKHQCTQSEIALNQCE